MMDKPENIPSGKHCDGKTFCCPWLYDGNTCELLTWEYKSEDELVDYKQPENCGGKRLPSCIAKYPHGGTVKIEVNLKP